MWDIEVAQVPVTHINHKRVVADLTWSPLEPNILASCSADPFIIIWDIRTPNKPQMTLQLWNAGASMVRFNRISPYMLASAHEGQVRIWDLRKTGKEKSSLITAHMAPVSSMDWSYTNENEIVTSSSASSETTNVKIWDCLKRRNCKMSLFVPTGVRSVRFTPFGHGLITASQAKDEALSLWAVNEKADKLQHVHHFVGHTDPVRAFDWRVVEHHGTRHFQLVSLSDMNRLRMWRVEPHHQNACGGADVSSLPKTLKHSPSSSSSFSESKDAALAPSSASVHAIAGDHDSLKVEIDAVCKLPHVSLKQLSLEHRYCELDIGDSLLSIGLYFPESYPFNSAPAINVIIGDSDEITADQVSNIELSLSSITSNCVDDARECVMPCVLYVLRYIRDLQTKSNGTPGAGSLPIPSSLSEAVLHSFQTDKPYLDGPTLDEGVGEDSIKRHASSPSTHTPTSRTRGSLSVGDRAVPLSGQICPPLCGARFTHTGQLIFFNNILPPNSDSSDPRNTARMNAAAKLGEKLQNLEDLNQLTGILDNNRFEKSCGYEGITADMGKESAEAAAKAELQNYDRWSYFYSQSDDDFSSNQHGMNAGFDMGFGTSDPTDSGSVGPSGSGVSNRRYRTSGPTAAEIEQLTFHGMSGPRMPSFLGNSPMLGSGLMPGSGFGRGINEEEEDDDDDDRLRLLRRFGDEEEDNLTHLLEEEEEEDVVRSRLFRDTDDDSDSSDLLGVRGADEDEDEDEDEERMDEDGFPISNGLASPALGANAATHPSVSLTHLQGDKQRFNNHDRRRSGVSEALSGTVSLPPPQQTQRLDTSMYLNSVVLLVDALGLEHVSIGLSDSYHLSGERADSVSKFNSHKAVEEHRPDLAFVWDLMQHVCDPSITSLSPSSVSPWAFHPCGGGLIHSALQFYAGIGDIQTVSTLACVAAMPPRAGGVFVPQLDRKSESPSPSPSSTHVPLFSPLASPVRGSGHFNYEQLTATRTPVRSSTGAASRLQGQRRDDNGNGNGTNSRTTVKRSSSDFNLRGKSDNHNQGGSTHALSEYHGSNKPAYNNIEFNTSYFSGDTSAPPPPPPSSSAYTANTPYNQRNNRQRANTTAAGVFGGALNENVSEDDRNGSISSTSRVSSLIGKGADEKEDSIVDGTGSRHSLLLTDSANDLPLSSSSGSHGRTGRSKPCFVPYSASGSYNLLDIQSYLKSYAELLHRMGKHTTRADVLKALSAVPRPVHREKREEKEANKAGDLIPTSSIWPSPPRSEASNIQAGDTPSRSLVPSPTKTPIRSPVEVSSPERVSSDAATSSAFDTSREASSAYPSPEVLVPPTTKRAEGGVSGGSSLAIPSRIRALSVEVETEPKFIEQAPYIPLDSVEFKSDVTVCCPMCKQYRTKEEEEDGDICCEARRHAPSSFFLSCSICELSTRGLAIICTACNHGGHSKHIQEWFQQYEECPTGCGCRCRDHFFNSWDDDEEAEEESEEDDDDDEDF